ncbi:MAG: DUF4349 domain-containing protein [Cyanobacteria bacterium P01_D01_bin.71]
MRLRSRWVKQSTAWAIGYLGAAALIGCSGAPTTMGSDTASPQEAEITATAESAPAQSPESDRGTSVPTGNSQPRIKLIKNATLQLEIDDTGTALTEISNILARYQGDLLQLSDRDSQRTEMHQVDLQLRVPQNNLEAALEALRELGTVETQSISAEDVSTQLVDLQARVRNLRKSEESLLEIMERSGSIADVLEVSQELSTVRETIERSDAQLKNLQNQVAYSTISLTLISPQPATPTTSPIGETLSETWQTASAAMKDLSVGLLQLLLWLLAFSPYIGILVLSGWLCRRYWRRQRPPEAPVSSTEG